MTQENITTIQFVNIDDYNRPVFKDDKGNYYGDTENLFPYEESESEVKKTVSEKNIVYFGRSFNCEPMGSPANVKINWKQETLVFEGAGWPEADSSKATDLQNCRIRTKFTNDYGKNVYLEVGEDIKGCMYVSHCYYCDMDENDKGSRLVKVKDWQGNFSYCKASLLQFVNKYCGTSFTDTHTDNTGKYYVFSETPYADMTTFNLADEEA